MTLALATAALLALAPQAPPAAADLGALFGDLEAAIRGTDAAAFATRWDPAGHADNLVGGSGLAGAEVFAQATRKRWFLKADLSAAERAGRDDLTIVPCAIWSWERDKAVDRVYALVVRDARGRLVVLGAGEDRDEVRALAARLRDGRPLAPGERETAP